MNVPLGPWRIRLLGDLCAERGGVVIRRFGTQKTGLLLAYLACSAGKRVPREVLAEILWPESDPIAGRANLRVALHSLRYHLAKDESLPDLFLTAEKRHIGLSADGFFVDAVELERICDASGSAFRAADAATRAKELYRGEFLPGFYDPWVDDRRSRLAEIYYACLRRAARESAGEGNMNEAMEFSQRALALDNLREEAHLDIIELYARSGRQSAAIRQFRALEALLKEELGERPSAETRHAVSALLRQQPAGSDLRLAGNSSDPRAPRQPRLPLRMTPFFGRETELRRLETALTERADRLVTITGPPGCGKTRIAVEFGRREVLRRGGAVWFVSLAEAADASSILPRVRDAVAQPGQHAGTPADGVGDATLLEQIAASAGQRNALIILDNVEHLLPEAGSRVELLLASLPAIVCMVTSRQALAVSGERELPLVPLPVPPTAESHEVLEDSASIALFVDRAQAARPDFQLTPANSATIHAICRSADGLPLAIELAAAWIRSLAPAQILERMGNRFDLLVGRHLYLPVRHQSLSGAIGWSVGGLPIELRRAFACLSVFRGGWTLEAAQALLDWLAEEHNGRSPDLVWSDALRTLDELRARSLLVAEPLGVHVRYRFYESMREYGAEQIHSKSVPGPDARELACWHLGYFARIVERAEKEIEGASQLEWLGRLAEETDNIRSALQFAVHSAPNEGLRLACDLYHFWVMRNRTHEGLVWLDRLIEAILQGRGPTAEGFPMETRRLVARAHQARGRFRELHGELGTALYLQELSLSISRAEGDLAGQVRALSQISSVFNKLEAWNEAYQCADLGVRLSRELRDGPRLAEALGILGLVTLMVGAVDISWKSLDECRRLSRSLGDAWRESQANLQLVELARLTGRSAEAAHLFDRSIELTSSLGDLKRMSDVAFTIGLMREAEGEPRAAATLHLVSQRLLALAGEVRSPDTAAKLQSLRDQLRMRIGEPDYDAIERDIAGMDAQQLAALALDRD